LTASSHERHNKLPCTTCHDPASKKSKLTFEPPRGCQICHHQAPSKSDCASCHEAAEMASPHEIEVSYHRQGGRLECGPPASIMTGTSFPAPLATWRR
jgi:hypothetical protein